MGNIGNVVESPGAAGHPTTHATTGLVDDDEGDAAMSDSELASLVRRWVGVRRQGALRVAPEPAAETTAAPAEVSPGVPAVVEAQTAVEAVEAPAEAVEAEPDTVDPAAEVAETRALRVPALPHRPTGDEVEHATRLAVLIDARRVSEDVATGLLELVAERGAVNVCRAYADWSRTDLSAWVARLRQQGLHSFHQFADDDDQALVAMAIDAVDIAREASVDELVIAGDMTSMLPLVHRLHAAGVRVVVVGPAHTPHDVRAACDEFLDADHVGTERVAPVGRHRA